MENELITHEQWLVEAWALADKLKAEGKPAMHHLMMSSNFEDWPKHLQADAMKKMKLEPVQMYRRTE